MDDEQLENKPNPEDMTARQREVEVVSLLRELLDAVRDIRYAINESNDIATGWRSDS